MKKFKHIEDLINKQAHQPCARPGCAVHAEHKAPVSRDRPGMYQWLCLEHVQEFNKKWDYFQNMSQHEIEHFQWDATTGHRPTWKINPADARSSSHRLRSALNRFMGYEHLMVDMPVPPINAKDKHALADLDLSHPCTTKEVKTQYKKLAKKYHPDRNLGDKQAEERFKQITASYHHLIQHYCESNVAG